MKKVTYAVLFVLVVGLVTATVAWACHWENVSVGCGCDGNYNLYVTASGNTDNGNPLDWNVTSSIGNGSGNGSAFAWRNSVPSNSGDSVVSVRVSAHGQSASWEGVCGEVPTPTPTPDPTPEPTPEPTIEPTPVITPTIEPTPIFTPTIEPTPTFTPTIEPTPEVTHTIPTIPPPPTVTPTPDDIPDDTPNDTPSDTPDDTPNDTPPPPSVSNSIPSTEPEPVSEPVVFLLPETGGSSPLALATYLLACGCMLLMAGILIGWITGPRG